MKFIFIDEIRWFNVGAWYALSLMKGLRKAGHMVEFIGKGSLPPVAKATEAGFDVDSDFWFTGAGVLKDSSKLAERLKDFQPDAVVAMRGPGQNIAIAARTRAGLNVLIIRARIDAREPRKGQLSKKLFSDVLDGVITPSEKMRETHISELGMDPARVIALPGGVDVDEFSPDVSGDQLREKLGVGRDEILIGSIGRLDFVKGHEHFLKVASLVNSRRKDVKFIITGEEINVKREELHLIARGLGLGERCHIIPERMDMPEVVAAIDIAAISSIGSEALSRVALEAFAGARPVVSTRVGVLDELIEEGINGYIVPPEDPPAMADAVMKVIEDRDAMLKMGKAAREKAEKELSRQVITERFVEFVKAILAMRPGQKGEKE